MNREQLEHLIRAAGEVSGQRDLIIIGSQAILGAFPYAPEDALMSREADMYPRDHPEAADQIEGVLGAHSRFDETHGYHADGVGPETAALPRDWKQRLISIDNENTSGYIGWCLDPDDLAAAKLIAGREKDHSFVTALLEARLLSPDSIAERIAEIPDSDICTAQHRQAALAWLAGWSSQSKALQPKSD